MTFTDTNGRSCRCWTSGRCRASSAICGAAANAEITEAFGGEAARLIGTLAQDTDRLKNGIDQLGQVRGLEQAEKMAQAMVDPWQQFTTAVTALRMPSARR
jgi:hypothetical protein